MSIFYIDWLNFSKGSRNAFYEPQWILSFPWDLGNCREEKYSVWNSNSAFQRVLLSFFLFEKLWWSTCSIFFWKLYNFLVFDVIGCFRNEIFLTKTWTFSSKRKVFFVVFPKIEAYSLVYFTLSKAIWNFSIDFWDGKLYFLLFWKVRWL